MIRRTDSTPLVRVVLLTIFILAPLSVQAGALVPVSVQLQWRHQFQFAGFSAAKEKGFYAEAGLDVALHEYSEGIDIIDAFVRGEIDAFVFGRHLSGEADALLSAAENDYLESKQRGLTYCFNPIWIPYDYLSEGEHKGIFADYLALFAGRLGVKLIPVPSQTWGEALELARQRQCDLISGVVRNSEREAFLRFTSPYFDLTHVLLADSDAPFVAGIEHLVEKVIGLTKGVAIGATIRGRYPQVQIFEYDSGVQVLKHLDMGQVYATVVTLDAVLGGFLLYRHLVLTRLNRQLKTAKEEAEDASRAKSEFLANMSHEMCNPMNTRLMVADLTEVFADPVLDKGLVVAVSDSGIGIPKACQQEVFEPFSQGSSSGSSSSGVGLGLAICERLARLRGGDVRLSSAPGVGSTFTLRVPLVVGVVPPQPVIEDASLATESRRCRNAIAPSTKSSRLPGKF